MKINKNLLFIAIIFVAAFLRFYKLSSVPASLDWDEVAIGWNAKTIFHTRRDEYGTRLPLSFKSFGDYKAPVYIYLTAPIVGIFGMNEISVRFLSAFTGVLSVALLYLLVKQLIPKKDHISPARQSLRLKALAGGHITYHISLLSATLLTISPWHLLLSRPAFEPNLALFFILSGVWFFLLAINKKPFYFALCSLLFALSLYTYHSPKIFVPVFLLGLVFIFKKKIFIKKNLVWILASAILGIAILLPLGKSMLFSESGARFQGTSIFYTREGEKKPINLKLASEMAGNYLIHYSPKFLFLGGEKNPRIQMRKIGPLLLIEAPFLLWGLLTLIKQRREKWAQFLLWWFLVGPIAAMVGFEIPHPIRAFNALPALLIISSLGISQFILYLKKCGRSIKISLAILMISGFLINTSYFLYRYFIFYPVYSAPDWQYGYKEIVKIAQNYEDKVNKIVITSHYGQPHVFTFFYQNRKPQEVFWGAMTKYLYRDIDWFGDQGLTNVLLIGTPEQIPENMEGKIAEVNFPDGSVAFRIIKTE